jgi:hypothetical protein
MKARALLTVAVALSVGWFGRSVWSDDKPPERQATEEELAWAKLGQPGEEHARLKVLVGEWDVHAQMTSASGNVESDGTASFTMLYGDRYLRQEFKGNFQGMPFEGRGIIGYDNGSKKWFGVWIDSMSTGMMTSQGEETQKGKSWTFKGSFNGPKSVVESKDVLTVVSDKEWTFESTMSTGDKMLLRYKKKA